MLIRPCLQVDAAHSGDAVPCLALHPHFSRQAPWLATGSGQRVFPDVDDGGPEAERGPGPGAGAGGAGWGARSGSGSGSGAGSGAGSGSGAGASAERKGSAVSASKQKPTTIQRPAAAVAMEEGEVESGPAAIDSSLCLWTVCEVAAPKS